jgi:hypothetical protein
MKKLLVVVMLLMAACRDERPPAPSAQEAGQLNEAEDLLNSAAQNEEGPADRSTSPSNRSD